jgi:hypothetical protein
MTDPTVYSEKLQFVESDLYMAKIGTYDKIYGFIWIGVFGPSPTETGCLSNPTSACKLELYSLHISSCYDIISILCNNLH